MPFKSWFKGWSKKPSAATPPVGAKEWYELVFLMDKTLHVAPEFVQGAIEHAFGVRISGKADSAGFVTGDWPVFIYQLQGRMCQIKCLPRPYFDQSTVQIVPGDRRAILARVQDDELKAAVREHQGLIAVWQMQPGEPGDRGDAYDHVGKMLAAFAPCPEVRAIVWPAGSAIRLWEDDLEETLKGGAPLDLFKQ
jgi:hypothetical protein